MLTLSRVVQASRAPPKSLSGPLNRILGQASSAANAANSSIGSPIAATDYRRRRADMSKGPTRAELENVIREKIRMLLEERGSDIPAIRGADTLNGALGLSSLDLAIVVAELESALGIDPFSKIVSITSVRSVDDLVEAYLKAYLPRQPEDQDGDLLEAARRARGRRARQGA
jgi:acyl carrier protein